MSDDGRPWWFVPERSRNLSAPVAAVLLAMGTADLVRAGVSFWLGWLLVAVGVGLGVVVLASQRRDDREHGRGPRRVVLWTAGLLAFVATGVALNVVLGTFVDPS